MSEHFHSAADLLLEMEAQMRRIGLWESQPPSPTSLASTMPFCYDTLELSQWLQWVFLPRMRTIVEQNSGWPVRSEIFPLAEHTFAGLDTDTRPLLDAIQRFDRLINERG